ncbi:cobalt-precorrin-5B (C(1))-methyltransferase [Ferrimonas sp. SCSIO 43195]|uniref:cobalt-precorrin-5B (C(1))-methyltransferase n=1 Tax=Ferrimonas sp. SCSIO 43195 TaxID=2822844 RepID=UPI0020762EDF|nr:cobalt-precorrin-5B (C(1))-methyltransferase [Ferrimonas sp. SCSIO 43195]USD39405.1 cobalt-precorrin-5B (C(1))-methyltransferase [Ferrimonas sp. SCSIO 43195]
MTDPKYPNTQAPADTGVTRIKRSRHRGELRTGYTTGACATAAALAALEAVVSGRHPDTVVITLPIGEQAEFAVLARPAAEGERCCAVIKDAGDDPDCTHGAAITVTLALTDEPGIVFAAGEGVATVTLPGLELAVGEPAINPVPRKMIREHLLPLLQRHGHVGARVTVSIPGGEQLAEQTIGRRLGLIGGLSILGTRGTVHPYSTSAYAASVRQSIEVARAQEQRQVVLTTGSRTEKAAMALHASLPQCAFIQVGDFSGVGLRASARQDMAQVELVTMIGKLCKMVGGTLMTHVTGRPINFSLLADHASGFTDDAELLQQIRSANTGRHLLELGRQHLPDDYWQLLCTEAARHCADYAHHSFSVVVRLVDFDGSTLAQGHYGDHV